MLTDTASPDVLYSPQGSSQTAAGQTMLENYLQGIDSDTVILGSSSSTPIESLQLALSQINLSPVTIPALHQNLINAATLEFPTNIVQTGVASTSFTLANPFTASINLLKVAATVTFQNLTIGTINNVDLSSNPIRAPGHSNVTSPALPFDFNLDPLTIIELIATSAQEHNVDLGPLTQLFQLVIDDPSFHPPVRTSSCNSCIPMFTARPRSTLPLIPVPRLVLGKQRDGLQGLTHLVLRSGNQFDFDDAILNALKGLQVDLAIISSLELDDCKLFICLALRIFTYRCRCDEPVLLAGRSDSRSKSDHPSGKKHILTLSLSDRPDCFVPYRGCCRAGSTRSGERCRPCFLWSQHHVSL